MVNAGLRALFTRISVVFALISACMSLDARMEAQASYAATKPTGYSVFGGVSSFKPDFGAEYDQYRVGFVVGGDVTYHLPSLNISLEPRFGHFSALSATQSYFTANFKVDAPLGPEQRLHPYGLVGVGYGTIKEGIQDSSTIYAAGLGIDVDVTHNLGVKGEFQYQFWNLGGPHSSFNPNGYTAALIYRFARFPSRRK